MITSKLQNILNNITPFTHEQLELMGPYFELVQLARDEVLLEEGQNCTTIFLVESGMLRNYYNNNGLDINLSFTLENQFTTSFEAYINREPSKISIGAMEKSVVWKINNRDFPKNTVVQLLFQHSSEGWLYECCWLPKNITI
jgi:CRP-like cAMP-binding protein